MRQYSGRSAGEKSKGSDDTLGAPEGCAGRGVVLRELCPKTRWEKTSDMRMIEAVFIAHC